MPPKAKGKKGKKGQDDDDAYWEAKAAALESGTPPVGETGKSTPLDLDDDEEGGGGLMSRIKASKKDKKKKKNAFADLDDELDGDEGSKAGNEETRPNLDDEWPEDDVKPKGKKGKKAKAQKTVKEDDEEQDEDEEPKVVGIEETRANLDDEWPEEDVKPKKGKKGKKAKAQKAESEDDEMDGGAEKSGVQTPAEVTKPDLDDEWPEDDVKPKGKKGKKGKAQKEEDEDEEEKVQEKPAAAAPAAAEADEDAAEDDGAPKILTKKEKEKLKKEKEKEKKRAQAAAKKAAAGGDDAPASPAVETQTKPKPEATGDDDAEDGADGDDATAADKKKKKKKKAAAAKAEPAPAPAAKGKKVPAHIAAMQAAMIEKQRIEEEARQAEAERQRKLDEEEAVIAAEEARIQAQKDAKKAKEKEKRAQAKADGRLLTPAQKKEKAAAEARKQALLSTGVIVAGLQQDSGEKTEKKKPTYAKKKPGPKGGNKAATSGPASPVVPAPAPAPETKAEDDDDWDKSEDDAAAVEDVVKGVDKLKVEESEDDWDKSSEDEAPTPAPAPAPAAAKAEPTPPAAPSPAAKPAASSKSTPTATAKKPTNNGNAAAAAAEESSDEDEDDDEDDEEESSDEDDSSEESDSSVDSEDERRDRGAEKVLARRRAAEANKNTNELRSPICCILGHVDHGKTRLLDKIRQTSVAEGEAGGITQQIGATFFPADAIRSKSDIVNTDNYEVKIPGLLIIDTPGHEAFANLRTRGSSLCNIAILVVDITQSFQPQTVESLNLLKKGKTPFIVALNKIDKLYGWQATPDNGFRDSLSKQSKTVKSEFEDRLNEVKLRLSEQGLNSELFDENRNLGRVVSLVPTSAFTGEGIPDMLLLLAQLTQERMNSSLMYISDLSCTILEVKSVDGMGMTIDVILSNGHLKLGDTIVLCGTDGPIVSNVRALLTPQPLRELRIKSSFVHNPEVKAALGVKIYAPGLDKAIAGARLFVANDEDEVAYFKDIVMDDLSTLERFTTGAKGKGVYVQASTLGALEALLTFLQSNNVPVFDFGVGPVFSRTIRGHLLMLERAPEYSCILAFDVPIDGDARALADKEGIKIFTAPVIYHLFDAFQKYLAEVIEARKRDAMGDAVWPVRLSIIQAFAHRDPIILGCDIVEGSLRTGTPVGVVRYDKAKGSREIIKLGKITSLEKEHKVVNLVKKKDVGGGVAVKIERAPWEPARLYGRHFDDKDEVVSLISRQSIDTLKNVFRDSVTMDEWKMIRQMKIEQGIN